MNLPTPRGGGKRPFWAWRERPEEPAYSGAGTRRAAPNRLSEIQA